MKTISIIHLQYVDDKGERLRKLLEGGKPFIISIVPVLLQPENEVFGNIYPVDYYYPEEVIGLLRGVAKNPNIVLAQEGFVHYCPECFSQRDIRDPFHEHVCLDGKARTLEEQREFMQEGRKLIEGVLGISPKVYCPPNHLFNEDSFRVAQELGFEYFLIRAKIDLPVYRLSSGLIVIPEAKFDEIQDGRISVDNVPAVYTYYDYLRDKWDNYLPILQTSVSISDLGVKDIDSDLEARIQENERLKLEAKRKRDEELVKEN